MKNFKEWFGRRDDSTGYPNMAYVKQMFEDASLVLESEKSRLITQDTDDQGRQQLVGGADKESNPLIPYGKWRISDKKLPHQSGFLRDQPDISRFALANPDNLAAAIIFVLLTIRADFQQVMHDFPVIMAMLKSKYNDKKLGGAKGDPEEAGKESKDLFNKMQIKLAQNVSPKMFDKDKFAAGYSLNSTLFGFKHPGVADVWNRRDELFHEIRNFADKNDPVGMLNYLLHEKGVTGLLPVKAGFVVQIVMGKLGCIDMHNINLYSQYARHYGKEKLFHALEPKNYGNRKQKHIEAYLSVLDQLAAEGAETMKLWDYWTNYVAHNYTNPETGEGAYDTTGAFAGHSVDPDDPLQQKFKHMGIIPNRPGAGSNPDSTFSVGDNPGANTGSQAHRYISHIRNKQFYYDLLKTAEEVVTKPKGERDIPHDVRISTHERMPKFIPYVVTQGPEMLKDMGFSDEDAQEFYDRARRVSEKAGLFSGKDYTEKGQKVFGFDQPQALGKKHIPRREKVVKPKKKPIFPAPEAPPENDLFGGM